MLQNWVGNGIGSGSSPLTSSKYKFVNLVIFRKQDGNSSSICKYKMIENRKINLKPWKVILLIERETRLDNNDKVTGTTLLNSKIDKIYVKVKEEYQTMVIIIEEVQNNQIWKQSKILEQFWIFKPSFKTHW